MNRSAIASIVTLCGLFAFPVLAQTHVAPPAIIAHSLTGDWKCSMGTADYLLLHLSVDAAGRISGTLEAHSGHTVKTIPVSDFVLNGRTLSYTMVGMGKNTETVAEDGNSLIGGQTFTRERTGALSPADLVGDWLQGANGIGSILRLRSDHAGSLTGSLDVLAGYPGGNSRTPFTNVHIGPPLTFTVRSGVFTATLSADGKTISTQTIDGGRPIVNQFQRYHTAAETAVLDANEIPSPTDGNWEGIIDQQVTAHGGPNVGKTARLNLHIYMQLGSNPTSCAMEEQNIGSSRCEKFTLVGNHVHLEFAFKESFEGIIGSDAKTMRGTWRVPGEDLYRYGPIPVTFNRVLSPTR